MRTICFIFVVSAVIVYIVYFLSYKLTARKHQRVSYHKLVSLMKIAPEKWHRDMVDLSVWYRHDDKTSYNIYMDSLPSVILLWIAWRMEDKRHSDKKYSEDRANLLKCFQGDISSYYDSLNKELAKQMDELRMCPSWLGPYGKDVWDDFIMVAKRREIHDDEIDYAYLAEYCHTCEMLKEVRDTNEKRWMETILERRKCDLERALAERHHFMFVYHM